MFGFEIIVTMIQNQPAYTDIDLSGNVTTGSQTHPVYHVSQCPSTMDLVRDLISQDRLPSWASVIADSQTSGRGQLGRHWSSPAGNVYGSLRLPLPETEWLELVPLVVAGCVADVLKALGLTPAVKWPNDILIMGRKAAGILVEQRSEALVAGIGINLVSCPGEEELHHTLSPRACYLEEFGVRITPLEIWMELVRHIWLFFEQDIREIRPETFITKLIPQMAYAGERVLADAYEGAGQPVIVKNIDPRGGLIVQTARGVRTLRSGSLYPLV